MSDKTKLRESDFITSLVLIIFSIWELKTSFGMPRTESFAGVSNVWYVAPGLLPMFIGVCLFGLGVTLLINSIRSGGAHSLITRFSRGSKADKKISDSTINLLLIFVALCSFVYLVIPRVDFFLGIANFLFFFIASFYFKDEKFKRHYGLAYSLGMLIFAILVISGVFDVLNSLFKYTFDVVFLIAILVQIFMVRKIAVRLDIKNKFRVSWIVSIATPALLIPVFRYLLLIQLPYEGGIIKLMNLFYYTMR
jgi:hypothetical protein